MTVKHSLLALLAESPGTGYALKQRYEERTGALWPVNIGQVYKTLGRLEQDGLVAHAEGDENALFELTELGRVGAVGLAGRARADGRPAATSWWSRSCWPWALRGSTVATSCSTIGEP